MLPVSRAMLWLTCSTGILAVTACSGPTINGFTLSSGNTAASLGPGDTTYVSVASTSANKTPVTAAIVVYNLPQGVSVSPASPTLASGSQITLTLNAAPNAPAATSRVQISGYAGLASSDVYVNVTVTPH